MSGVDSDGSNEDDSDDDTEIKPSDLIVSFHFINSFLQLVQSRVSNEGVAKKARER